jgi:hypothetical protein
MIPEYFQQFSDVKITKHKVSINDYFNKNYSIISEHFPYFCHKIVQNKIQLSKEILEYEYLNGMSLNYISKKYNINRSDLRFLRQVYQIKRKGANFIKRKQNDIKITQEQKDLIYGTLMGDGCGRKAYLRIKQSIKQKEYALWKYKILSNLCRENPIKENSLFDKRYNKNYTTCFFMTRSYTDIETINNQFYTSGKKVITQEVLDNLTPLSIAVWYMDDGTVDFVHRSRPQWRIESIGVKFCTDSFSEQEHELMKNWFMQKYGILTKVRRVDHTKRNGTVKYRLIIKDTDKFFELIRPYIIPSMLYKVDFNSNYKYYINKKQNKEERT